jgi:hypothetical protein
MAELPGGEILVKKPDNNGVVLTGDPLVASPAANSNRSARNV